MEYCNYCTVGNHLSKLQVYKPKFKATFTNRKFALALVKALSSIAGLGLPNVAQLEMQEDFY